MLQLAADVDGLALIGHIHGLIVNLNVGGGVVYLDGNGGGNVRVADRCGLQYGGAGLRSLDGIARHGDGVARCHTPLVGLVAGVIGQHLDETVQVGGQVVAHVALLGRARAGVVDTGHIDGA